MADKKTPNELLDMLRERANRHPTEAELAQKQIEEDNHIERQKKIDCFVINTVYETVERPSSLTTYVVGVLRPLCERMPEDCYHFSENEWLEIAMDYASENNIGMNDPVMRYYYVHSDDIHWTLSASYASDHYSKSHPSNFDDINDWVMSWLLDYVEDEKEIKITEVNVTYN